jgi:hypothetical protein
VLLLLLCAAAPAPAQTLPDLLAATKWGESSADLLRRFGKTATVLPKPLDFGDSYTEIVLRHVPLGGYPVIAWFQMDKTSRGLKRIQLERPRHAVNSAAFRATAAALEREFGPPDRLCGVRPGPAGGYQEAAERIWLRDGRTIRAIFRDTTIEAFEGCLATVGPCGLTAQLLVRISPEGADPPQCPAPPKPH